jgi:hypothetical protein
MDGTMSIISSKDYQIAISRGNGKTLFKIPSTPFPITATKTARRAATISPPGALSGSSIDTDVTDETERDGSTASKLQRGSSNAEEFPAAGKTAPSRLKHPERDSSEYDESSGEDEFSDIGDRPPPPTCDSPIRSQMVEKSKSRSSVDSAFKALTIKPPTASKSKGAGLRSFDKTYHKTPEDEMEDWEIEPGVIAGSDSDNSGDSETEHSEFLF